MSGLLKDNSWIRKLDDEDEDVDRDPNFGTSILGHRSGSGKSDETDGSAVSSTTSSVGNYRQRFGSSGEPKTSSSTTTISKDGKTTKTTETTTIVRSAVNKKTETFTERVLSSSKGYSNYSTPKPVEVSKTTSISTKDAEDHLYETLDPSPTRGNYSPTDSKKSVITTDTVTVRSSNDAQAEDQLYDSLIPKSIKDEAANGRPSLSSTETVTVRSSIIGGDDDMYDGHRTKSLSDQYSLDRGDSQTVTSSTSIRSYSSYTEDSPITSTTSYTISTKPSDEYSSDSKTYSYSSSSRPSSTYEYSSITSPTSYSSTTYRTSSRSDDSLSDQIYSKSSTKNVYSSSDRTVLEKDLCTSCRKPFIGDAKMVLEDIKINCHATCFKCDVCNSTLGNLKAGDSLWVYRSMVHCANCFEVTKAKWRR